MKPSTYKPISEQKLTSTGTIDTQTATIPNGTSGILVTVETNAVRMTYSPAGDPTTGVGQVVQKDQNPWFLPIGQGATVRFVSATASTSVVQLAYI